MFPPLFIAKEFAHGCHDARNTREADHGTGGIESLRSGKVCAPARGSDVDRIGNCGSALPSGTSGHSHLGSERGEVMYGLAENANVVGRFQRFVRTREAQLLCDRCGRGHHLHVYQGLQIVRDASQTLQGARILFRCLTCGTVRMWGQLGPHPELSEQVDGPVEAEDTIHAS